MCRKNGYSLREAKTVLNEVKRNRGKQYRKEIRYYKCDKEECKGLYHLTSKTEYFQKEIIPFDELLYKEEWKRLMDV
mgnify:CR=1 FL=1